MGSSSDFGSSYRSVSSSRYIYRKDDYHHNNMLDVSSNHLFGRDAELKILQDMMMTMTMMMQSTACADEEGSKKDDRDGLRLRRRRRCIAWVHGRSGSGKTSLCRAALGLLQQQPSISDDAASKLSLSEEKMMFVIDGKYDQVRLLEMSICLFFAI